MINLLFLLATAQAADVFEFCVAKKQKWSERYQRFETEQVQTYYSYPTIQFIVYQHSFEVDRDSHPIMETTTKNGMTCWREHENSEICYDRNKGEMYWEWTKRSGDTFRNVLSVCKINGE